MLLVYHNVIFSQNINYTKDGTNGDRPIFKTEYPGYV